VNATAVTTVIDIAITRLVSMQSIVAIADETGNQFVFLAS